ncbi:MAG: ATP-binding protein [candidate division KSB1 bacterium]|nr:ATP-binding protein [candidate division KSB1 bacterium]
MASAERDARALAAALEAPPCGFAVTLLLGAEATAQRIRHEIIALRRQAKQHPLDIIVAFCGHGVPVALNGGGNETFLATHDFTTDNAELDATAFLSLHWLYQQVYEAAEPHSVLLILDHCYAGNIRNAGNDRLTVDLRAAIEQYRAKQRAAPAPRDWLRAIIAATRPGEPAGETATGGLLTQALLAMLRGETLLHDGQVTIGLLDHYLKQRFAKQSQQPYIITEGNYSLTLADYRERIAAERAAEQQRAAAERAAAEQQRRRAEAQAMLERWRSPDSHARAAELQASFVGREQELEAIQKHIEQLRPTGGYLLVTGVAGQGKSSILAHLANTTDPPIPAYFIRFTPGPGEQAALLGHLIAELLAQHGLIEEALTYLADNASPVTLHNSLMALLDRLAHERPLTLMIDGLDQIPVDRDLGQRDLGFLPERLPAGVVIVIGTRPDDTLVPLKLLTACREYPLPPLSLADFATLLDRRGVALSEADRAALHTALHGNAFDLAFLAQELQREPNPADAQALIRRVITNPRDIFTPTIERLKREPLWDSVIEPILGLLVAAQEPLSLPALASILERKRHRVTDALTLLRGLLGERDREGQARYFLLHLKLIEYLRSNLFPDNELVAFHNRLAQWGERDFDRLWQPANDHAEAERRAYAQTHLVYHLVHAQAYDRLWRLLDANEYGAAKRQADPSLRRYALDLDLARRAVVEAAGDDIDTLARSLPRLWQYSLLRCSLTSQIDNWPTELFTALVALGRSAEARDRAELLSNPERRAEVLLAIGHALLERGEQEEAVAVWRGARKAVNAISDASKRTERLCELATAFAQAGCYDEARTIFATAGVVAETVDQFHMRTKLLAHIAQAISNAGFDNEANSIFDNIVEMVNNIQNGGDPDLRYEAVASIVTALAQTKRYKKALEVACIIPEDDQHGRRIDAFQSIVESLHQHRDQNELERTFLLIHSISKINVKHMLGRNALRNLAKSLVKIDRSDIANGIFNQLHKTIDVFSSKIQIIDRLYTFLAQGNLPEARMIIETVSDDYKRDILTSELVKEMLTWNFLTEARSTADTISDYFRRSQALHDITIALLQHKQLDEAYSTAIAIPDREQRATTLLRVAKAFTHHKEFRKAQDTITRIYGSNRQAIALADCATAMAYSGDHASANNLLEEAIKAISNTYSIINNNDLLAEAYTNLSISFMKNNLFNEADAIIARISFNLRFYINNLTNLATHLFKAGRLIDANRVFTKARNAIINLPTNDIYCSQYEALINLARGFAYTQQFDEAYNILSNVYSSTRDLKESIKGIRDRVFLDLARAFIQIGRFSEAQAVAQDIDREHYPYYYVIILSELIPAFVREGKGVEAQAIFIKAYNEAENILEPRYRVSAFRNLAIDLVYAKREQDADEIFAKAFSVIHSLPNQNQRINLLQDLSISLAACGRFEKAHDIAKHLEDPAARANVLIKLATALANAELKHKATSVFSKARRAADAIASDWHRAEALTELAQALTNANRIAEAVALLAETWQQAQTRDELLRLFAVEAELIRAYPEIGAGFVRAFAWVEEAMRRGT